MISEEGFPRCDWSGLQRIWCPPECPTHGDSFTMTAEEQRMVGLLYEPPAQVHHVADLEQVAGHRLDLVRFEQRPAAEWRAPTPKATRCDGSHRKPPGAQLCHACADTLGALLADTPVLLAELDVAIRKDVRFVEHGAPPATVDDEGRLVEESPLPVNLGAVRARTALVDVLTSHAPGVRPAKASAWIAARLSRVDQPALLCGLSTAVRHAHQVIDRPRDLVSIGRCPLCGLPLEVPRPSSVELEFGTVTVTCPSSDCTYNTTWALHQRVILDQAADTPLTIGELVGVLTHAGEPIPRKRIEYLVERHGLPRERQVRWHQRGHERVLAEVWTYRLRDVRELQAHLAANP